MKDYLFWTSLFIMTVMSSPLYAINSISRHGITWTFQENIPEGQYGYFVNGDPWVVGPVTITAVSPTPTVGRNGTVINPIPNDSDQGFDDRIKYHTYNHLKNIGGALPYLVTAGSSVVSTVSNATIVGSHDPAVYQIDVLTVLREPASSGDFRPPYLGTDKSLNWNMADLDLTLIPSVMPVASALSLSVAESYFEHPWIEMRTSWTGRYHHSTLNHPTGTYGREMAQASGQALLTLALNYSNTEKQKLLISAVQAGIDIYGAARLGAKWNADGGHNPGRKLLLLLAGKLLADSDVLDYADGLRMVFQEDQQTFYVTQREVDITNGSTWNPDTRRPTLPYKAVDIGMPEWGIRHHTHATRDNAHWSAIYRGTAGSATFTQFVAAKIWNVESEWNWPAFFDYYARYFTKEWPPEMATFTGTNGISTYAANMYLAYVQGENDPVVPTVDTVSPSIDWVFPEPTTVQLADIVSLSVNAEDDAEGSGVRNVEFYLNDNLIGLAADNANHFYTFQWDSRSVANGSYSLKAVVYDRANNQAESAIVNVMINNTPPTLMTNIIGYWHFNETQGIIARDASGNAHHATVTENWVEGKIKNALSFTRSASDQANLGNFNISGNQLTLAAWVNPSAIGTDPRILAKSTGTSGGDMFWVLEIDDGETNTLGFRLNTNGATTRLTGGEVDLNQWMFVVATYDGNTMRLYQDGLEVASVAKTGEIRSGDAPVWVGDNPTTGGRDFEGMIDEIRIYYRVLSPAEIVKLRDISAPGQPLEIKVLQPSE